MTDLCPEREFREALSDAEFWDYVLLRLRPGDPQPDGELSIEPRCRLVWPYDDQGRELIHAKGADDD